VKEALKTRFDNTGMFPFSQDISKWTWTEFFETMEIVTGSFRVTAEEMQQGVEALRKRKATWQEV